MIKDISEKITEALQKFYTAFQNQRVLKTMEEVEANTNEDNIPSAVLLGELYNNLTPVSEITTLLDYNAGDTGTKQLSDSITNYKKIYVEITLNSLSATQNCIFTPEEIILIKPSFVNREENGQSNARIIVNMGRENSIDITQNVNTYVNKNSIRIIGLK